jgi:hypothetical protein
VLFRSTTNTNSNTNGLQAAAAAPAVTLTGLSAVQIMRETIDPLQYPVFEKMKDVVLPSAKLLDKLQQNHDRETRFKAGSAQQLQRVFQHNGSLGRSAIELRDSRGRLGRDTKKGFENIFSSYHPQNYQQTMHSQSQPLLESLDRESPIRSGRKQKRGLLTRSVRMVKRVQDGDGNAERLAEDLSYEEQLKGSNIVERLQQTSDHAQDMLWSVSKALEMGSQQAGSGSLQSCDFIHNCSESKDGSSTRRQTINNKRR